MTKGKIDENKAAKARISVGLFIIFFIFVLYVAASTANADTITHKFKADIYDQRKD